MLRKSILPVLLILFVTTYCESTRNVSDSFDLKRLHYEHARNTDCTLWEEIYETADHSQKIRLVSSISKIGHSDFLPFLKHILETEPSPELFRETIFALGQLNGNAGEPVLLSLDFDALHDRDKSFVLETLGRCGTESSVAYLRNLLPRREYTEKILKTAALLARRGIDMRSLHAVIEDTTFSLPVTPQLAYYYSNNFKAAGFSSLSSLLSSDNDTMRIHTYKTLYRKMNDNAGALRNAASADSSGFETLRADIRRTLSGNKEVFLQWYALKLLPLVGDSSFIPSLERYSIHPNPHLQIASYQTYSALFRDNALAFLMAGLSASSEEYVKGQIIIEISKISPKSAFPFINNNLGSKNITFLEALLRSLGNIPDPIAVSTIRQFLNVPDARLSHIAFEILDQNRKLRAKDVEALLTSDASPMISAALEWKLKRKIKTDSDLLITLFEKFSDPGDINVQQLVTRTLKELKYDLTPQAAARLISGSSNRIVWNELLSFPDIISDSLLFKAPPLPEYLAPDSLLQTSYRQAVITTSRGDITLDFTPETAPLTVRNFIALSRKGFYNGLTFHRSVPDFVIQGGDPLGLGYGGPGYLIPSEDNELPFVRGSVGMATSGYDTGGSQFFICHSDQPHLDRRYTLFALVSDGLDVVDRIIPGDTIRKISLIK